MTKYDDWITDEGLSQIESWASEGLTNKDIAKSMGVAYSTFREWAKKFPALSAPLKKGKQNAIDKVENALFKKAVGYDYDETTYKRMKVKEKVRDENGDIQTITVEKEVKVKRVSKHVAPDTGAAAFFLKNRDPENWKDKKETQLSGSIDMEKKAKEIEKYLNGDTS